MTLSEAQTNLAAAQAAYTSALEAKSVGIGARTITRQNLLDLQNAVTYWTRIVADLSAAAAGSTHLGVRLPRWQ